MNNVPVVLLASVNEKCYLTRSSLRIWRVTCPLHMEKGDRVLKPLRCRWG